MDYFMISRVVVLVAQCLESVLQRGTASAKSQNTQRNAEVRASVVKDDMQSGENKKSTTNVRKTK